jgi:hypothetical protein
VNKKLVVTRDVFFEEEKSWNWISVEPVQPISYEIFTVVYNEVQHADDQGARSCDDMDADATSSGAGASRNSGDTHTTTLASEGTGSSPTRTGVRGAGSLMQRDDHDDRDCPCGAGSPITPVRAHPVQS